MQRLKSDPKIKFGKETFIRAVEGNVLDNYKIIRELGTGSFGRVMLVQHKVTKKQYAIKSIDKRNKTNLVQKLI